MDFECESKINDAEFPAVAEFSESNDSRLTKAVPFRDIQTQKVYRIVKFKQVKVGKKEEIILTLTDAEKNEIDCWVTS